MMRAPAVAVLFAVVWSGCSPGPSGTDAGVTHPVEIFSWWRNAGETEALNALLKTARAEDPSLSFSNRFSDNTSNGELVALQEMLGVLPDGGLVAPARAPAELMQENANRVERQWVTPGVEFQDLGAVASAEGWSSKFRPDVLAQCTIRGKLIGVPMGMHRINNLIYNRALLTAAGVTAPPTDWASFKAACDAIKASGKTCVTTSNENWVNFHLLWAVIIMTVNDPQRFRGLYEGTGDRNDPKLDEIAANYLKVLNDYTDRPRVLASLGSWNKAADEVYAGRAAFFFHGDWAVGYLKALGWTSADFQAIATPGGRTLFVSGLDAFYLPATSRDPQIALHVAKIFGDAPAQTAFNKLKGSTSPRLDLTIVDDPISANTYADLQAANIVIPPTDRSIDQTALERAVGTATPAIDATEFAAVLRATFFP